MRSEDDATTTADVFRTLDLVLGSAVIAIALVVVVLYSILYVRHRRADDVANWKGLLPRHVAAIGVSYIVLTVAAMAELVGHIHNGWTWRIPLALAAFAFGIAALWDVLGHSRHRLANLNPPKPPVSVPEDR